ncbi:MAG: RHS repeat-associated core domain-containing protein, partial [Bacteroidales bacterium]|nr:RHS repeat-associated core domain-containing protein [Bacteroidales bacterium]
LKTPADISPRQCTTTLHTTVDGKKQYLQCADFQHLFCCKNTSSFTGKEKDSETGLYYFGARYYDPSLSGLFLSVDPMADKYPSLSPYAYCAWNPVKLVDPDGREIHLTFTSKNAIKAFNKIINGGLGGQFKAAYSKNKDGSYTLSLKPTEGGGNKDKLTERQQAFYEKLSQCIEDKETIANISVVYGSSKAHVGNYITNTIDVADMLQFDDLGKGPCTKQGKLIHEFVEQYEKASCGRAKGEYENYTECHQIAISAEDYVNGSSRKDLFYSRGVYGQSYTDKSGKVTNYYYSTHEAIIKVRKGS